ncbi:zinc ABC transporter substrate-binding protein [Candidatus Albibeggiatoa sp. nov. BB20]|uniref:metal ABC transporter solute-binding protein, Zn/Mn family n=1 Tax=Candidatus Albibeggiatoa sp. nov. BB20 TaxID=3162723 RepID=UPI0033659E70
MKSIFSILFILLYSNIAWAQLPVYVSILPQKYFVERIGGEHVNVSVMVQAGHSPATYEPTPQQMVKLSQTKLYFKIGVPFENVWLHKLQQNNPQLMVIDTRQGIDLQAMPDIEMLFSEHHEEAHEHEEHHEEAHEHEEHHEEAHEHEEHHEEAHEHEEHHEEVHEYEEHHEEAHEHEEHHEEAHQHGEFDPHIWLSPRLVKVMAQHILQQLIKYDPEHKTDYQQNHTQFIQDLNQLDAEIQQTLSVIKDKRFMVFHPSWGYFAQAYGLQQIPIEIEGKSPNSKDLVRLINYAQQQNIKVIFVQKQFSQKAAQAIADNIQAQLIVVDPLAENYIQNLSAIAHTFVKVMK